MRTRKSVAALGTLALCAGMAFGQPGRPAAPGTPGTPGAPGNSGSPGAPAAPGKPGAPATPGVPGTPGAEPVKAPKPEPGQIDLRPRFTLGRITRYQMDLVSNNKTKLGKDAAEELKDLDNQEQTMSQGLTLSLTVKEVSAEGATIELSYDRMKVAFKTADMDATFDSAQPRKAPPPSRTTKPRSTPGGSNPGTGTPPATPANLPGADGDPAELLAQIIKPMVGTKLTMKVDNNGNITSVSGGDALAGNGLSGLGGSLAGLGGGLGGLPGGLGNIPTPTAGGAGTPGAGPMNWMISGVAQRPFVRVGESWTNTDSLGNTPVGDFKMVTKHTCKSSSRGQANFSFSGRADQGSAGGSPNPTQMFQLKETTYSGDYAWDLERGELRNMNSTMTTSIDGRFMGSTITLNANTKVTVRQLN